MIEGISFLICKFHDVEQFKQCLEKLLVPIITFLNEDKNLTTENVGGVMDRLVALFKYEVQNPQ